MKLLGRNGSFNWVLPLMLLVAVVDVLLSGRDLSMVFAELAGLAQANRSPLMPWIQRGVSVVMLLVCAQRIADHFAQHRTMPAPLLTGAFVLFWITTVASPALLGAHRVISHEFTYALLIGFTGLLVTTEEIGGIVDRARDALMAILLISVALIPIWPGMVLDESYTQGLIPGLPRLGGVAPHPVALGMFAQTALILLWARPYAKRWLNVMAWILGLGVLFMAQSKTAWIGFTLCSIVLAAVRNGPSAWRRLGDPREGSFGILLCLAVIVAASAIFGLVLFSDIGGHVSDFMDTDQGAQLSSMTGRDQIWAVAFEEWHSHPWFGYGPGLFDDEFRMAVNMPQATHGHNQWVDTLARSGVMGATGLAIYGLTLLVLSIKYARRTSGLSLALFIAIALRSVSEVPLLLLGYGTEFFPHLLLLATLSAAASMTVPVRAARARPMYGVPA
jgi:O-antigen ligase